MSLAGATDADISAALKALKIRVRDELGDNLAKMVLFGSRARGDNEPEADVDVAVVVRGLDSAGKRRILDLVADVELEYLVPLSTLVMSTSDFAELKAKERRIARDIERDGVPL